ncbi:MAG TPA: lysophospholipid acyltransferase family protein [Candidatus Dormibacteraeota bacterium]
MIYAFLRWLARRIAGTVLAGILSIEGREKVPRTGALLVCPNHIGTVDPPLVPAYLPRGDSWSMAKSEYFANPGFTRWIFTAYQAFPVVRHTADRAALRRAFALLNDGHALVVYPEGTRVEAGVLAEPEPGAGFLALRSQAPVLPVAITGTQYALPKGRIIPTRHPVRIAFGRPFRVRQQHPDGRRVRPAEATDAIMLTIAEMLPPQQRGRYADLEAVRARVGALREYEPES